MNQELTLQDIFNLDQKNIAERYAGNLTQEEALQKQKETGAAFLAHLKKHGFPFKNTHSVEVYKQAITLSLHLDLESMTDIFEYIKSKSVNDSASNRPNMHMGANYNTEEIDLEHMAFFTDKIRLLKGQPQLYGTQFKRNPDRTIVFKEIEDAEHVNDRRKSLGMSTIEEYKIFAES